MKNLFRRNNVYWGYLYNIVLLFLSSLSFVCCSKEKIFLPQDGVSEYEISVSVDNFQDGSTVSTELLNSLWYVTPDANGYGTSWDDPSSLKDVMSKIKDGDVILVKKGKYHLLPPLSIYSGVSIIGGCEGCELSVADIDFDSTGLSEISMSYNSTYPLFRIITDKSSIVNIHRFRLDGKDSKASSGGLFYMNNENMGILTTLNISKVIFENGTADIGGAIYCQNGYIKIDNSIFKNNVAEKDGACIYTNSNSKIEMNSSTAFENIAERGSCIYLSNELTDVKISNSIIVDNYSKNNNRCALDGNQNKCIKKYYIYDCIVSNNKSASNTYSDIYNGESYSSEKIVINSILNGIYHESAALGTDINTPWATYIEYIEKEKLDVLKKMTGIKSDEIQDYKK